MIAPVAARHIRQATDEDRHALFEICLRTADSGGDGSELYSDPRLPGYVWAVPYLTYAPAFAFVLVGGGRVLGYTLAAPDTAAFAERLEREWWPQVRRAVAGLVPTRPGDAAILRHIAEPEPHPTWLLADYPAHMHINILADAQSAGWGRRMIEVQLAALKAAGVAGVHLGLDPKNQRARSFYRHLGFEDVSREGHVTFAARLDA